MAGTDGLTTLQRLKDAALHAMHIRTHLRVPVPVELRVLPVGIEVEVRSFGRATKRLLGWETIEQARFNVITLTIDEMVESRDARTSNS